MRKVMVLFGIFRVFSTLNAQDDITLNNRKDSISYAVGVSMFDGTKNFKVTLDYDMVARGFLAASRDEAYMRTKEANDYIIKVETQLRQAEIKKNRELGRKFM